MNLAQEALARKLAFAAWWQSERGARYLLGRAEHLVEQSEEYRSALNRRVAELDERSRTLQDALDRLADLPEGTTITVPVQEDTGDYDLARQRAAFEVEDDLSDLDQLVTRDALADRARRLLASDTFYVTDSMVGLVNAAYASRPPEPLRAEHLIKPSGFAWFEQPALLAAAPDTDGWSVGFDAVSWETRFNREGRHGVLISGWQRTNAVANVRPDLADLAAAFGEYVPESYFFRFGDEDTIEADDIREAAHTGRWVQSMWSLMGQPLVSESRVPTEEIERHLRKRAHREGTAPEISIVTLRRKRAPSDPDDEPSKRNYSHRWIVRGFWRQQWYPKTEEHRPLWINDYIKGPEDRPFLVKDRVYAWRR